MSDDAVARLRELFGAFNRGDIAKTETSLDEFVVWDGRGLPMPDLQNVYHGPAGVADFWRGWLPMWERVTAEILWIDAMGERVVAWVRQTQVGRESGVEANYHYGWDVTFRDGKIIRVSFFDDEERTRVRVADLGVG